MARRREFATRGAGGTAAAAGDVAGVDAVAAVDAGVDGLGVGGMVSVAEVLEGAVRVVRDGVPVVAGVLSCWDVGLSPVVFARVRDGLRCCCRQNTMLFGKERGGENQGEGGGARVR